MSGPPYEPVTASELVRWHSARPGSAALQAAILSMWGDEGAVNLGIYHRRRVAASSLWSLHAVGRAGDVGVRRPDIGNEMMLRLVAAADTLGVCEVIWSGRRWTGDRGTRDYHGPDAHRTHLHWGQTRRAANDRHERAALVALFRAALDR